MKKTLPLLVAATRRLARSLAGTSAVLVLACEGSAFAQHAAVTDYVVHISVDGLRPDAVTTLGPTGAPNFYRLRNGGVFTDNARTDYDYSNTIPNHTTQITGRRVAGPTGHGWLTNTDPAANETIHTRRGSYVASVFDVVHDHGRRAGGFVSKTKLEHFNRSYDATHGAPDVTGPDNGRDKIDHWNNNTNEAWLTNQWVNQMSNGNPLVYSFIHYQSPDRNGHDFTWSLAPGSEYLQAVQGVDTQIGRILDLVEQHPALIGRTTVIVTADHGGMLGTKVHEPASNPEAYTIPFYVWGAGVTPGDLYALNPATRANPGAGRPDYAAAVQPIRNGDAPNLALRLLGLPPIPGSTINTAQDLVVGPEAVGSTVVLAPDADAVTRGGTANAGNNYGALNILEARDTDSSSTDRRSFLRFDLGQVPAGRGIAKASLWLYVTISESPLNAVHFVTDDAWNETNPNGITWSNMPPYTTPALDAKTVPAAGNWVEFDVTAAAKTELAGDGLLSLALVSHRTANAVYSSREGSHPPHLVIRTNADSPAVLAHWRFEAGSFRADSSGNGRNLSVASTSPTLLARPVSGSGSRFSSPLPQTGAINNSLANFGTAQAGHFTASDTGWMDSIAANGALTVEAYANVQATHTAGTDIVSQWRASAGERSFRFGINASRQPFLSISPDGNAAQTFTASTALSLNTDYYLAATFDANDPAAGVKIYIKNLTTSAPLQIQSFANPLTAINNSPAALNVGAYNNGASTRWKGLIDEVRISDRALPRRSLLISRPEAEVLAHWRFESGDFRGDSSGNGRTLSNASTAPTLLARPSTGAGSKFSHPLPQTGAANNSSANFGTAQAGHFTVANTGGWMNRASDAKALTLEAFVNPQASHTANTYIVSHWRASAGERSFMLGINSSNTLVLVVSSDGSTTQNIASNFTLSLNTDYYVAAAFDAHDPAAGVKFYLRNLTSNGALQTQSLPNPFTTLNASPAAVNVGTYNNASGSRWKGLIDEVRISAEALHPSELLISTP